MWTTEHTRKLRQLAEMTTIQIGTLWKVTHTVTAFVLCILLLDFTLIFLYTWQERDYLSRDMTKTNKVTVRPAKTQISLGIRPVWSVFAVRMKKAWVLSYPLSAQQRLWSDWADAQADLSLRWAHSHFVGFVMSRLI